MKADTRTVQDIFHGDRRFVVPVFQRPYVWELEKQWEPLWSDVEATAIRLAEARTNAHARGVEASAADQSAPPHFLGAIVMEDRPVMTGDVDTRLVVDGQQRLTTLQLLLRGVLDALDAAEVEVKLRARIRKAIKNDDEVVRENELLKIAPRQAEHGDFSAAMSATAPEVHQSKFAAARDYFGTAAASFLADQDVPADPYSDGSDTEARAALLAATLLGLVKVVAIDLEDVDDAQVIFEALNARNTPCLPQTSSRTSCLCGLRPSISKTRSASTTRCGSGLMTTVTGGLGRSEWDTLREHGRTGSSGIGLSPSSGACQVE